MVIDSIPDNSVDENNNPEEYLSPLSISISPDLIQPQNSVCCICTKAYKCQKSLSNDDVPVEQQFPTFLTRGALLESIFMAEPPRPTPFVTS